MTFQCSSMTRSVVPADWTAVLGVWKRESGRAEWMNYLACFFSSWKSSGWKVRRLEITLWHLIFRLFPEPVLTSPSQFAHVLYMSPFTLCLHRTWSSGLHSKPGEMLCLDQIFVCSAEFGRINDFGYEQERRQGLWAPAVMWPQACVDAAEMFYRPTGNSESSNHSNFAFKCNERVHGD